MKYNKINWFFLLVVSAWTCVGLGSVGEVFAAKTEASPSTQTKTEKVADANATEDSDEADTEATTTKTKSKKTVTKGVRFVFKDFLPSDQPLYYQAGKGKFVEVKRTKGLPGPRCPYSKSKKIVLINGKPLPDDKDNAKNIVGSITLPQKPGAKTLAVLVPNGEKYKILLMDESKFKSGETILRNYTKEELHLKMGSAAKELVLKPGEESVYIPEGYSEGSFTSTKAVLYRKDDKTGKWYTVRNFTLTTQPRGAEINMFVWNDSRNIPDLQKITIVPDPKKSKESSAAGSTDTEDASGQ